MINITGAFITVIGAIIFGLIGNLPMTIAMLAGVIYFKELLDWKLLVEPTSTRRLNLPKSF